jgi:hypothetical protein
MTIRGPRLFQNVSLVAQRLCFRAANDAARRARRERTSELSLRGNWTTFFGGSAVVVDSKGALEQDFRVALLHILESRPST